MMTNNKSSLLLLYVLLLLFLPTIVISSSTTTTNNNGIKYKHITVYQHDTYNVANFIIVPGIKLPNFPKAVAPFGRINVLNNNLTLTPKPSSKVVGKCEALTAASSFDGLYALAASRFSLELETDGLKGTISVLGVAITNSNPSNMPVAGGTEDFVLVQGYITTTIVTYNIPFFVYKIDFHLYWPPYAPYSLKN